jgi:hypothetical protein
MCIMSIRLKTSYLKITDHRPLISDLHQPTVAYAFMQQKHNNLYSLPMLLIYLTKTLGQCIIKTYLKGTIWGHKFDTLYYTIQHNVHLLFDKNQNLSCSWLFAVIIIGLSFFQQTTLVNYDQGSSPAFASELNPLQAAGLEIAYKSNTKTNKLF